MGNKVLVTLYVPHLDRKYDLYIPVNKRIYAIIDLIKKTIFELSNGEFNIKEDYELYNLDNGYLYNMNDLVRNTDIRNNSRIVIV